MSTPSDTLRIFWCTLRGSRKATVDIDPPEGGSPAIDFTTVLGATILATHADGTTSTWSATIEGTPTPTRIRLSHALMPGDLKVLGPLRCVALLDTGVVGAPVDTDPFTFRVVP